MSEVSERVRALEQRAAVNAETIRELMAQVEELEKLYTATLDELSRVRALNAELKEAIAKAEDERNEQELGRQGK